jgi:cytochrome c oxidase assembly protein subunit 15
MFPVSDQRGSYIPESYPLALSNWLFILAGLIFSIVLVGGATRLTGSGLSITEWRPITGVIPPLTPEAWEEVFALYRQIPQYTLLNSHMSLADFKVIYFWEWGHRLLGRMIGLAFLVPWVFFFLTQRIQGRLALGLLFLGILGGLQGVIGWIMVRSGFAPGHIAVAPTRLALHLLMAHILCALCMAFGIFFRGIRFPPGVYLAKGRVYLRWLLGLFFAQIVFGALVAGLKAGLTYNTWPLMDGYFFPASDDFMRQSPWWLNILANPLSVQFIHRMIGYSLVLVSGLLAYYIYCRAPHTSFFRWVLGIFILMTVQMGIGIAALLFYVPLWIGLLHQGCAVLIGMVIVSVWMASRPFCSE